MSIKVQKNVYLGQSRNHPLMSFCSKIYPIFKSHFNAFFNKRFNTYMSLNFLNLHTGVLILSTKKCVSL